MRKIYLSLIAFLSAGNVFANNEFPNLQGELFTESRASLINQEGSKGGYSEKIGALVEPKFTLNLDREWSIVSSLKIAALENQRDNSYDTHNTLSFDETPHSLNDYGIIVEEIKGYFKGDDMGFFFGKYNPRFGKAWNKRKRMGIFTSDFTQDYKLTEKIGIGVEGLLENEGVISINSFFNDTTALSNSAINRRGSNDFGNDLAGNNANLSSFSITASGNNFFEVEDLRYGFAYRDLDVDGSDGFENEKAMLVNFEYSMPINYESYFVPFIELVKINNFRGIKNRDVFYSTISLKLQHSSWNLGATMVIRDLSQENSAGYTDKQMQYFVGYKFKNGINLDVTHLDVEESKKDAKIFGVALSYIYEF